MSNSNKVLGTKWERAFCDYLANRGYWVHFIAPDARGAQPFDVVAAKDGTAYAFDCKTCVANTFTIGRLEDNQIFAFERWLKCGNTEPMIAVLHNKRLYVIPYSKIKEEQSIRLVDFVEDYEYEGGA